MSTFREKGEKGVMMLVLSKDFCTAELDDKLKSAFETHFNDERFVSTFVFSFLVTAFGAAVCSAPWLYCGGRG